MFNLNPHGLICNIYSPAFGGQIQPCFVKNCHLLEERITACQLQAAARVARAENLISWYIRNNYYVGMRNWSITLRSLEAFTATSAQNQIFSSFHKFICNKKFSLKIDGNPGPVGRLDLTTPWWDMTWLNNLQLCHV
jgi:hypothetical protein